jgi:hypothetical protein
MSQWTLGAIKSLNLSLEAYCQTEGCNHFVVFDLDRLIERNGPESLLPEIVPNMVCTECGGQLKTALAMLHPPEEDKSSRKD